MELEVLEKEVSKITVSRITDEGKSSVEQTIAREMPLTIMLNNQELVTLLCSPSDLNYLAIGFLFSEGLIRNKADIKKTIVDGKRGIVRVDTENNFELDADILFKRIITSGCGRGASFYSTVDLQNRTKVKSQIKITPQDILALSHEFQNRSQIYKETRCVHSAALCDTKSILIFNEDIGRHNAVDKILGECILNDIWTEERVLITSGRITSEILLKIAHRNIPILISRSVPTDLSIKLANDLGITLIGFVRARRINVYTQDWRIEDGDKQ
jgi:FdhD protein